MRMFKYSWSLMSQSPTKSERKPSKMWSKKKTNKKQFARNKQRLTYVCWCVCVSGSVQVTYRCGPNKSNQTWLPRAPSETQMSWQVVIFASICQAAWMPIRKIRILHGWIRKVDSRMVNSHKADSYEVDRLSNGRLWKTDSLLVEYDNQMFYSFIILNST